MKKPAFKDIRIKTLPLVKYFALTISYKNKFCEIYQSVYFYSLI